jgi:hypothetical protein
MSEFDQWDDENEDAREDIPDLRKAYRQMKKQNKELLEQLTATQKQVRERSVKDVLQTKGLPAKIAAFLPESVTTSEEVESWLEEYGDVFGINQEQEAEQEQKSEAVPNPELEALGRISATQQSGQPFSNDPDQIAGLIAAASSPEELNKLLFGSELGPQAS